MDFQFESRPPESPFIDMIWRSRSETAGFFTSLAGTQWMMVVTKYQGETLMTVRGPESKATLAYSPVHGDSDSEFFGVVFKLGTFMPHLPPIYVADRNDALMPDAGSRKFWMHGSSWEFPTFDNVETFVNRLIRQDMLVRDAVVEDVLKGCVPALTPRAVQKRFLRATGLTHTTIHQIERAQHAVSLLQQGVPILETVHRAGYYDQPHLTRSLKHFMGQTPSEILRIAK
jgi:hypothetical protein